MLSGNAPAQTRKSPACCGVSPARCRAGLCRVRRSRRICDWPLPANPCALAARTPSGQRNHIQRSWLRLLRPSEVNQMKYTAVALTLTSLLLAGTPVLGKPKPSALQLTFHPWSCRMMHMRQFLSRPCPNPGKTLGLRIPIRLTRLGTHLELRRRVSEG